jgi:hypothetical protein
LARYRTEDVSSLVTQGVLLMVGANDHYMPLHMLPDQLMTLTAAHSVTAWVFIEVESASEPLPDRQYGPAPRGDLRLARRHRRPDGQLGRRVIALDLEFIEPETGHRA